MTIPITLLCLPFCVWLGVGSWRRSVRQLRDLVDIRGVTSSRRFYRPRAPLQ